MDKFADKNNMSKVSGKLTFTTQLTDFQITLGSNVVLLNQLQSIKNNQSVRLLKQLQQAQEEADKKAMFVLEAEKWVKALQKQTPRSRGQNRIA